MTTKFRFHFHLAVATLATLAAPTAFADRYWVAGSGSDGLWSTTANWADGENGTGGSSVPDTSTSSTYWYGFHNGKTIFDAEGVVQNTIFVSTTSDSYFVWEATDPANGLKAASNEFHLGNSSSRSPAYLQIDSGTYSFGTTRIGYASPVTVGLKLNGCDLSVNKIRVGGGKSNVNGTLILNSGNLTTRGGGADAFMMCDQADSVGTMIINGGMLDTTSADYTVMGGVNNTTSTILMKGGTWNTKGAVVGGKSRNTLNSADNAVARVAVDGGTLNASGEFHIGTTAGSGTLSEMVVSNGTVNIGGAYIYIGRLASGSLAMEGGELNLTGGFLVGGKEVGNGNPIAGDNMVSRLVVNGGTINAGANCSIGSATGTGTLSEMIVSNGVVNINSDNLYVGDRGPGALIMEGGEINIKDTDSYGLSLGHCNNGVAVGTVTLNGGTIKARKVRLQYTQPGSRIIFNGGTLKAKRDATSFLDANENLTCEVQAGGLSFDTAGFNVEIKHPIALADGVDSAPLIKKGVGQLTISGDNPFEPEDIIVYAGTVVVGGVTYEKNAQEPVDASAGGFLGELPIHSAEMESWLDDADFSSYARHGATGAKSLDQALPVIVDVRGRQKVYANLEVGGRYSDTLNGVSYIFETKPLAPRTLRVLAPDGTAVRNVRDFGGWPLASVDGTASTVQGVIFRGGNLDHFAGATAEDKAESVLAGIKSEIDLRQASEVAAWYQGVTKSCAAVDADYVSCPIGSGEAQIDADDVEFTNQIRRVFSRLGTAGALPAYIHGDTGADRTGVVGLLLLGVMGVEEESLYRDYLASNFADIGGLRDMSVPESFIMYILRGNCNDGKYVYGNNGYGKSLAARCRAYLEMCGVTYGEIANITHALSGETPEQVLARVDAYEAANGVRTVSYVDLPGGAQTNAIHRLVAGSNILPTVPPTREYYTFAGWDTGNEIDDGGGEATVCALWDKMGYVRFWADGNGDNESFARYASWDPAPNEAVGFSPSDKLGLNKGISKVATLSDGESVEVGNLYIGWGTLDGTTMVNEHDHGARLDVTGGELKVVDYLFVGAPHSDDNSNVMNVTGGKVTAGMLIMSDCDANVDRKSDTLNISGTGVVEAGAADKVDYTHLGHYSKGLSYVNITDGGTFIGNRQMDIGYAGRAYVRVDGGTADLQNNLVNVGRNAGANNGSGIGQLVVSNGTWTCGDMNIAKGDNKLATGDVVVGEGGTINATRIVLGRGYGRGTLLIDGGTVNAAGENSIGRNAEGSGMVRIVSGSFNVGNDGFLRVGHDGKGVLTVDGGTVNAGKTLKISTNNGKPGSALNLNGGRLSVGEFTTSATTATMNWNGGVVSCNGLGGEVFFPLNANVVVNVLRGGAVYETAEGREGESVEIAQPMSGIGAFVKRGPGTLSLTGGLDLGGGFKVEGGTLIVSSLSRTDFMEISVDGGTLDLNGASVRVYSYKVAGVAKEPGVYSECGGTITVAAAGERVPATAVWNDYAGDEDVGNPANWTVTAADGLPVYDALPDANTDVFVPSDRVRPDLSLMPHRSSTYIVAEGTSMRLRGDCTPPAVVAEAVAWYDPDDELTLEKDSNGTVTGIRNKGAGGADLDLVAYDLGSLPTADSAYSISTRQPLVFPNNKMGFVSKKSYEFSMQTGVSLVAVMERLSGGPVYGIELDNNDGNSRLCAIAGTTDHALVSVRTMSNGVPSEYRLNGLSNQDDGKRPLIYDLSVGPTSVSAHNIRTNTSNGVSLYTANDMENLTDNVKTGSMSYESLPPYGALNIYYGMRRQPTTGSYGLIGEAMVFSRPLTDDECAQIREYLSVKWFNVYDMSNMPENITVEEGAEIDFGGGLWTFGDVKGTGTIADDIRITNSIEPGLTVGGTVVFAPGAKFDITPLDGVACGTEVVFLTAGKIVDWPARVSSDKRAATLSLVDNGDGTVSLVGTLTAVGFTFNVR